jgi:hypothetical protein
MPHDTEFSDDLLQVDFVHPEGTAGAAAQKKGQRYMNGRDCVRHIWRTEGFKGFFAGLSVNIVRGVSGAVLLVLYDDIKKLLA